MKLKTIFIFFSILSLSPSFSGFADEVLTPTEIVKRSDDLMRGDSIRGTYSMLIETPTWKRELKLYVYGSGRDKMFIRILAPDKEKGIGTLRVNNEMWNYLPRVEKLIKIPPSLMLQPWMGSDFANDDLVKESSIVNDYTHRIIREDHVLGDTFYVIELLPKPGAPVIWGKIVRYIQKDTYLPFREEYHNEQGKLIKVLEYWNVGSVSDRKIPLIWKMIPINKPGFQTTIRLLDVQYNKPVDEQTFSLSHLKKVQ
jgi:outer membrane lipoprotein-sorting protein